MTNIKNSFLILSITILILTESCLPKINTSNPSFEKIPDAFGNSKDTTNTAGISWKKFFTDSNLIALIDTAIIKNPEANMTLQEIEIASNEVKMRHALLSPIVKAGGSVGVDKAARYTSEGAGNASTEMTPGHEIPEPLGDFSLGFQANWEADIWHKLRNSKKSAVQHYLATQEGRNFVLTNLVAEIANSYYELLALDKQLNIIHETVQLQTNQLEIVKTQKEAGRATALAIKQFEAQLYYTQSLQNDVEQNIVENENKINFLLGRYPQKIKRDSTSFINHEPANVSAGLPSNLLINRPDIKQAEHEMQAAGLDILEIVRAHV